MPKATAVWLVENTTLTFEQIAEFCGLHALEVKGIADGEVAVGIRGLDPVVTGQLSLDALKRCEQDPSARLKLSDASAKLSASNKRARYTPVSKRHERPNAIAWLVKNYSQLSDAQIARLLGTTNATIAAVRDRTHWNAQNISPQDPVLLGLCNEPELVAAINLANRRRERAAAKVERGKRAVARSAAAKAKVQATPESATEQRAPAGESVDADQRADG
jgi:hypothetical protein